MDWIKKHTTCGLEKIGHIADYISSQNVPIADWVKKLKLFIRLRIGLDLKIVGLRIRLTILIRCRLFELGIGLTNGRIADWIRLKFSWISDWIKLTIQIRYQPQNMKILYFGLNLLYEQRQTTLYILMGLIYLI